ncbi:hypothetical protein LCGC14_2474190 [marine sediment metagenome]|uniref:Uncharacterized protein n=1 Tax=marine sediment metagenome TaxID=412755 RepID=A0A0F9BA91_9ZZZZ
MSDWATATAARIEMKHSLLKLYDKSLRDGFTRDEARAICEGGIMASVAPHMWPLMKLWLDQERP